MEKYKCACCENYTLEHDPSECMYEICPVCFWEDDPIQNEKSDYFGGASKCSLIQAKENYKLFGANEIREVQYVRAPREDELPINYRKSMR